MAEEDEYRGQMILADPIRPVVYRLDVTSGNLSFVDTRTGGVTLNITVGAGPRAMDLTPDRMQLFVTLADDDAIAVVDVSSPALTRIMRLSFSPLSIQCSASDVLYVSGNGSGDGCIRSIDAVHGNIRSSLDLSEHKVTLELSPDYQTLIAIAIAAAPVDTWRLNARGFTLTVVDSNSNDISGPLEQAAAIWTKDRIYFACYHYWPIEILTISTLDLVGYMLTEGQLTGVCLSPDEDIVYAVSGVFNEGPESYLWAFNSTSSIETGHFRIDPGPVVLAASSDGSSLFTAIPLRRISLEPTITLIEPAANATFAFTPGRVSFDFFSGLRPVTSFDMNVTLDGIPLEPQIVAWSVISVMTTSLPDGIHQVCVNLSVWQGTVSSKWNFAIDRASASSRPPSISPRTPLPWSSSTTSPYEIEALLDFGDPAVHVTNWTMTFQGEWVPSTLASNGVMSTFWHDYPLQKGIYSVTASASWGPENVSTSWVFIVGTWTTPSVTPLYPSPGDILSCSPSRISFLVSLGSYIIEIDSCTVILDGVDVVGAVATPGTQVVPLTYSLNPGAHHVKVNITWDGRDSVCEWNFQYVLPPDYSVNLSMYSNPSGFSMLVINEWSLEENVTIGNLTYQLRLMGPIVHGVQSSIGVYTEADSTVTENQTFLESVSEEFVAGIRDVDPDVSVGMNEYRQIANHSSVVISLQYSSFDGVQKVVIIVSEAHARVWILIFTANGEVAAQLNPAFDTMLSSFEITLSYSVPDVPDETPGPEENPDALAASQEWRSVAVLTAAAIVILGAILLLRKRISNS
jgi:DNA-binding beta-propeller fold protein YncE